MYRGHARTHTRMHDGRKATIYKKKTRSLTLVLDSFVPSARVMDREKIITPTLLSSEGDVDL